MIREKKYIKSIERRLISSRSIYLVKVQYELLAKTWTEGTLTKEQIHVGLSFASVGFLKGTFLTLKAIDCGHWSLLLSQPS